MRPRTFIAALCSILAACDSNGTSTSPPIGGLLSPGTWYMHQADTLPLPAEISVRTVGVAQERTLLDSAVLVINTDLSYEQRYWTRTLVTGVLDRTDAVVDYGTLAGTPGGYTLSSSIRQREFLLTVPVTGQVTTFEQMLFFASDTVITQGTYRPIRP